MRWFLASFLIVSSAWSQNNPNSRREELYKICQDKVSQMNYGSQKWQVLCSEQFDMPGPYLIKCATWLADHNFPSDVDSRACRFFCSSNTNWGPWYDYEVPYRLKEVIAELKRIHDHGRCFEGLPPQVPRGF